MLSERWPLPVYALTAGSGWAGQDWALLSPTVTVTDVTVTRVTRVTVTSVTTLTVPAGLHCPPGSAQLPGPEPGVACSTVQLESLQSAYTALHYTTLPCIILHYTALYCTALHDTILHCI